MFEVIVMVSFGLLARGGAPARPVTSELSTWEKVREAYFSFNSGILCHLLGEQNKVGDVSLPMCQVKWNLGVNFLKRETPCLYDPCEPELLVLRGMLLGLISHTTNPHHQLVRSSSFLGYAFLTEMGLRHKYKTKICLKRSPGTMILLGVQAEANLVVVTFSSPLGKDGLQGETPPRDCSSQTTEPPESWVMTLVGLSCGRARQMRTWAEAAP